MRKTLVLPIAGLLAIGVAGAALAQSGGAGTPGTTDPVAPAAEQPGPDADARPDLKDTILSDVLDELVAKGTITRAQADAVVSALDTKRTELRTAREQAREQLRTFWADGVLTQDEIDQLPEDSAFRNLTTLLDDGKITVDELRGLGRGFGKGFGGRGFGHGFGFGPGPDAPEAAPSTSG